MAKQESTSLVGLKRWFAEHSKPKETVACDTEPIFDSEGELVGVNIEPVDGVGRLVFYPAAKQVTKRDRPNETSYSREELDRLVEQIAEYLQTEATASDVLRVYKACT